MPATPCSTPDECNSASMADAMAHITRIYIAGLLILGLFGNTYCVTAFLMPDYRRIPSSLYLSALALSDIGFLLTLGLMWMRSIGLRFLDMTHVCATCMFVSYFCCFVSSWLVLAVTMERYLLARGLTANHSIDNRHENWMRKFISWLCWGKANNENGSLYSRNVHHRRVRLTFVFIIIFGLSINTWVLFAADTVLDTDKALHVLDNKTRSDFSKSLANVRPAVQGQSDKSDKGMICDVSQQAAGRLYPIFNALDMIFSFTLPFLGVLILNLKIGFRVCKAQDLARQSNDHTLDDEQNSDDNNDETEGRPNADRLELNAVPDWKTGPNLIANPNFAPHPKFGLRLQRIPTLGLRPELSPILGLRSGELDSKVESRLEQDPNIGVGLDPCFGLRPVSPNFGSRSFSDPCPSFNRPPQSRLLRPNRLLLEESDNVQGASSIFSVPRRPQATRVEKIECKVTKLLVTVSLAYLVLNLPSYIYRIVLAFDHPTLGTSDPEKTPAEIIAETLAYLMFYTQFSINFFLYSCHGCMFGFIC